MKPKNLIEEVLSTGASLEVNGSKLVVKRQEGPLADFLLEELRRHKAEVISALNEEEAGQAIDAGQYPDIIPGEEGYPYNLVGERVSFLLTGSVELCLATKGTVFAQGTILSQRWLGYTRKGRIPEYELQIKTDNGKVHTRRLVEGYVS